MPSDPAVLALTQRVTQLEQALANARTDQEAAGRRTAERFNAQARGAEAVAGMVQRMGQRVADADVPPGRGRSVLARVFPAQITGGGSGDLYTWEEYTMAGDTSLTLYPDGRTGDDTDVGGGAVALDGSDSVAAGTFVVMLELEDLDAHRYVFINGGGAASTGKPVLLKHDGDDGDGYPKYDLYELTDAGLTSPIATGVSPENGRWRGADGLTVTAAEDGSVGWAYVKADSSYGLLTDAETACTSDSFPWETG